MEFFDRMSENKAKLLSPLVLAFVGDAVMTLYVREHLAKTSDAKAGKLHVVSSKIICSTAQAELLDDVYDGLSDDEKDVFHRCRNAKYNSTAKHGTVADYKKASGLEAVIGYNYLTGNTERCGELLARAVKEENNKGNN